MASNLRNIWVLGREKAVRTGIRAFKSQAGVDIPSIPISKASLGLIDAVSRGRDGAQGSTDPAPRATLLSKAFCALLKTAPSTTLFWVAWLCLKLKRPRRAFEALAKLGVSGRQRSIHDLRAVKQFSKLVAALPVELAAALPLEFEELLRRTIALIPDDHSSLLALAVILVGRGEAVGVGNAATGDNGCNPGKEAEYLFRRAINIEPGLGAGYLALTTYLLGRFRFAEAHCVAAEGVRCCPSSVELRLLLAQIQFQLRRYGDAANTVETLLTLNPNLAWAWYQFGIIARNSYERLGLADKIFERAAQLAGKDAALLSAIAQNYLYDLNYRKATCYFERAFALEPEMRQNILACRLYALSLNGCRRTAEAKDVIAGALQSCRATASTSSGDALQVLKREEWLLLLEADRLDEADAALRSIQDIPAGSLPFYARSEYLPRTRARLQHLTDIVGSRDVFVMAQGPSFAQFAARMHEFAEFDFAIATFNSFPPIEHELSRGLNRQADVLLLTHPGTIQSWRAAFEAFLDRPSPNLVAVTRDALSALSEVGLNEDEFLARHDGRLLFVHAAGGPPLPSRPLHFESGATISLLVPLLALGRPKRIFLVGADGGANPDFRKRPYFHYDDYDSRDPMEQPLATVDMRSFRGRPEQLQEANRRFEINAINADRIMGSALRTLEILFGLEPPPIFNVCPHSTHTLFPRIDIDTAIEQLKAGSGRRASADRLVV